MTPSLDLLNLVCDMWMGNYHIPLPPSLPPSLPSVHPSLLKSRYRVTLSWRGS